MYQIIIGFYLLYSAKNNFSRLFSLEYGIDSFTKIDWVLLVLSVLMIPLSLLMFYTGYRSLKEKHLLEKEEKEEQIKNNIKKKEELFSEVNADSPDENVSKEIEEGYISPYDS